MLTHILSSLPLDANTTDELFEAVGVDRNSVSLVVSRIVSAGCSAEQKYDMLLGGMSQFTSKYSSSAPETACIGAIAHGIAEVFDGEACGDGKFHPHDYALERHPMVRAMYLVRSSAFYLVERIETRIVSGSPRSYFPAVEPFLVAALAADERLHRCIRGMLARIGANGLVHVDTTIPFMVQHMVSAWDASTPDGMQELSEAMQDVVDVVSANDPSEATISLVLEAFFDRFQRGEATTVSLRCLMYFVDELSVGMILPFAIRGMQLGEDPNASSCFDIVTSLLSSRQTLPRVHPEEDAGSKTHNCLDALTLATLESICLRASFYCQPGSISKGSIRTCLAMCRSRTNSLENTVGLLWGPVEEVLYGLKLFVARLNPTSVDDAAVRINFDQGCLNGKGGKVGHSRPGIHSGDRCGPNSHREVADLDFARVLAHLSHRSVIVRLEALSVIRILVSDPGYGEEAGFFSLPVLLHAIRTAGQSSARSSKCTPRSANATTSDSFYMRDLLFTLSTLGEARACVPFIARTIQSMLTEGAPEELAAIAIRLLGRLFFSSRKAYASLKIVLLGCDMQREATEELSLEQFAAMSTLLDVCDHAPEKGKDFVHMIHECASSSHPKLAASGLRCIRMLCASAILDFEKAWVVISRIHPDLPEDEELASAWIELIGCALLEDDLNEAMEALNRKIDGRDNDVCDAEARATMLTNVIELIWEATRHSSPLVRAKAYSSLPSINWDLAEALDCLRPPLTYARLLEDETDPTALEALGNMIDTILEMEHEDRRRQLLDIRSQVPTMIQQSHRQRFYKLTQSIPRTLLKELSLLGSGSFIALNLKSGDYSRTGNELCAADVAASIDLMVEPEYIPLLVDAWTRFVERWCAASVLSTSHHSQAMDACHVWNELCLPSHSRESRILNPNILAAMVACASIRQELLGATIQCLVRNLDEPLQHQNMKNVCAVLAALCVDLAEKHVGREEHDELISCILRADVADEHRLLVADIISPHSGDFWKYHDDNRESDSVRVNVRKSCDGIRMSTVHAHASGALDDAGVCKALTKLSTMLDSPPGCLHAGYILLSMSRLLTEAASNGFRDGTGGDSKEAEEAWTLDKMVAMLAGFLQHDISASINVRENAGHACHGLGVCLAYQMKDMKNLDESCAQDNAVEKQLEAICSMPAASPLRMGCIPFIADMCARASAFKEIDMGEGESLGSLSMSAVGYLSESLIRGTFADDSRTKLLLVCLGKVPRLARKDWSACLRRCIKSNPVEGVQIAAIQFAVSHTFASAEFIVDNLFDERAGPPVLFPARRVALWNFDRLSVVMHGDMFALCLTNAAASVATVADAAALAAGLERLLFTAVEGSPGSLPENKALARDVLDQLSRTFCPDWTDWTNEPVASGREVDLIQLRAACAPVA